jgi:hypothetical protein
MEAELATRLVASHIGLAKKIQDQLDIDAIDVGITNRSVMVALLIYAAGLADRSHLEAYDFLQIADTARQIIDSGGKPAA